MLLGLAAALAAGLLIAWLPAWGGALFVGLVILAVATLLEPLIGLTAAMFVGLLRAYLSAWAPQIPSQIAQAFVALALAAWLARGLARREIRLPSLVGGRNAALLLALLVFLGAALLSLWDAVELSAYALPEFLKWAQVLLVFLLVRDCLTARRLPWLLGALLAIGLFQAGVGVWQFGVRGDAVDPFAMLGGRFSGWRPADWRQAWEAWIEPFAILGGRFYRAYGTFEQPNVYGGYVGVTLAVAVGTAYGAAYKVRQSAEKGAGAALRSSAGLLLALAAILALGAALVMSWSRGAWLGFGAAACAMALALPRKTRWGALLAAGLVVAVVGLHAAGLIPASITERMTGFVEDLRFEDVRGVSIVPANYAVLERLAHWQAALEMWRANFWTGVGFGCYEPAYADFALVNWPIALGHAHNYYLNTLAETGVIGLAAYLLLWGVVVWQTWQAVRRADGLVRGVAIGLLGAWVHLGVHNFLDNLYVNNVHLIIGALLGILAFVNDCHCGDASTDLVKGRLARRGFNR